MLEQIMTGRVSSSLTFNVLYGYGYWPETDEENLYYDSCKHEWVNQSLFFMRRICKLCEESHPEDQVTS